MNTHFGNSWRRLLLGLLCTAISLSGSSPANAQEQKEHDGEHDHEQADHHDDEKDKGHDESTELVTLSLQEIKEFEITLDTAGPGEIHSELTLPGEVTVNEDKFAHVSPRFSGLVKQVLKSTGDAVKKNDVLAVVESNESLTDFEVRSSIAGVIIDKHIVIGEITSSDTQAFTVADLSTVWVNLNVYPTHLYEVSPGQKVIVTPDHGVNETRGVIAYLSPTVDRQSRTARARVVIDNSNGLWRPGQFVEGVVEISSRRLPLVIPRSAIFSFENMSVVFVYHNGTFKPRPVKIGETDSQSAEILGGLKAGEIYASSNGFTIKAELEKGSFDSGHSH